MTSTLQQEGGRKLRLSAAQVMRVAQGLYERGYITYMRTDSTTLSETALTAARSQARELYGPEYVPDAPRTYTRKVKNAQEAHEAIRPAGETFRTPASLAGELRGDERALYDLIWKRTVASQMTDARGPDRVGAHRRRHPGRHAHRVGRLGPDASPSPATCGPTSRAPTTRRPSSRTASRSCRCSPPATSCPSPRWR